MTLTEFLLARIAEDEDLAAAPMGGVDGDHWWPPARVLAECESKRRIVEAHTALLDGVDGDVEYWSDCPDCLQAPPCLTLRLLALPEADHPDYREEWKP